MADVQRPEIPGEADLWSYSPEHRAELVERSKACLGRGPVVRGSTSWWATAVLTYEHMLRKLEGEREDDERERIACGATHPDEETESRFKALRQAAGFVEDESACGGGRGVWTFMFRCVECGRFFHRDCILKHFAMHAEGEENRLLVQASTTNFTTSVNDHANQRGVK